MAGRVLGCAALAAALVHLDAAAAERVVSFRAADGRVISGLFVEASQRPAPAVVLVPMLGRSRDDWHAVAQHLADVQISSLAIDLPSSVIPADAAALTGWHADIRAALDHLAGRADVRSGAFGIAGASLGANLAVLAAAADPRVQSLALISPSLDYRGVRIESAMRQYARPALLIASLGDPLAARTVRQLTSGPPSPASGVRETRWAVTKGHGTILLAREPDLVRALVEWFQRTLG